MSCILHNILLFQKLSLLHKRKLGPTAAEYVTTSVYQETKLSWLCEPLSIDAVSFP